MHLSILNRNQKISLLVSLLSDGRRLNDSGFKLNHILDKLQSYTSNFKALKSKEESPWKTHKQALEFSCVIVEMLGPLSPDLVTAFVSE